jgi:hypothetical protein
MPTSSATSADGTLEECIYEIDDFVMTLERYPPVVLASALQTHLGSLLRAMLESDVCTRQEAMQWLTGLERDVLEPGDEGRV